MPRSSHITAHIAAHIAAALAAALAATVLGARGSGDPGDSPDTFLAFSSTFAPFRTWPSFHSDGPASDGTVPPDVLGPRTQYITCRRRTARPSSPSAR